MFNRLYQKVALELKLMMILVISSKRTKVFGRETPCPLSYLMWLQTCWQFSYEGLKRKAR